MKANFKPLALASAVAAASASYSGVTQAQSELSNNDLGDLAIVPYYTIEAGYITGVHIINTSDEFTQVVKLRFRRGDDSMDALDFNLILSPNDVWTGFISDSNGNITVQTDDNSCTAPLRANGVFEMPALFQDGATEGYVEVIGMAQADDTQPISIGALHGSDGIPLNCVAVESNFFRNATATSVDPTSRGITSSASSNQTCTDDVLSLIPGTPFGATCASTSTSVLPTAYVATDNVLKVSFFHRDAETGLEFGNSAVHIENFSDLPMMSNQEALDIFDFDPFGYLFPDLDGGSPADTPRGLFEDIRAALGADAVINDWSVASARNVSTDWVITLPGQYVMLDLAQYTLSLFDADEECLTAEEAAALTPPGDPCDERDIPVEITTEAIYDREEQTFSTPDGGLVISPQVTPGTATDVLPFEVNVLQWTDGSNEPVLPSLYAKTFDVSALGADNGWAAIGVSSDPDKTQGIFNFAASTAGPVFDPLVELSVPIVGFVAWERSFPSDPSANYGRIVEHSYQSTPPGP